MIKIKNKTTITPIIKNNQEKDLFLLLDFDSSSLIETKTSWEFVKDIVVDRLR